LSPHRAPGSAGSVVEVVYGRNAVREALRGRRRVKTLFETEHVAVLEREAAAADVPVAPASSAELERLCGSPDHQGVVAEVEPYPYVDAASLLDAEDALVLALDQVQDPHNLGAVCRSVECAGATGVVLPERRSAAVTPAVCKASAGAVEHLRVARVRNLADFLAHATGLGAWVYGAEAGAGVAYTEPDYEGRTVVVLGSEGRGIRPRVRAACDQLVSLPVRGSIESLNVSSTAAVILYEALRKRADRSSAE
jgi:23S rRNA (guanosine2251-2'-O)-methyltransferase